MPQNRSASGLAAFVILKRNCFFVRIHLIFVAYDSAHTRFFKYFFNIRLAAQSIITLIIAAIAVLIYSGSADKPKARAAAGGCTKLVVTIRNVVNAEAAAHIKTNA